jgi:hypothetical protein
VMQFIQARRSFRSGVTCGEMSRDSGSRVLLKSRRDDLFIDLRASELFFLFFSGAGQSLRKHIGAFARAAEKQKEKTFGCRVVYKQVIPTGFKTPERQGVRSLFVQHW